MKFFCTEAFLIQKKILPNDDGMLIFFTQKFGCIKVFSPKLARSKIRKLEIDFFRLLEIEFTHKSSSFSLKSAHTRIFFETFTKHYEMIEQGFLFFERLKNIFPEEKPFESFFEILRATFSILSEENYVWIFLYLRIQMLAFSGVVERFDFLRGDVYFDPESNRFSKTSFPQALFIKNETRQVFEFLRRSEFQEFSAKITKLLPLNTKEIEVIIKKMEDCY